MGTQFLKMVLNLDVSSLVWGSKTYVLVKISTVQSAEPLEIARSIAGPMDIEVAYDVSGSMQRNMIALTNTNKALVDMAMDCTLTVGTFDDTYKRLVEPTVISPSNTQALKDVEIINRGGFTNLQDTIAALLQRPGIKILVTDGLANKPDFGLTSSSALTTFARGMPHYAESTIHTLGIENGELNSELLKTLALESGGVFKLTTEQEGIPAFLGDVFRTHLYTRLVLKVSLQRAKLLTEIPLSGLKVCSDAPSYLVFELLDDETAQPPPPGIAEVRYFNAEGLDIAAKSLYQSQTPFYSFPVATKEDIARILGCVVVAPILNNKYSDWTSQRAAAIADLEALKAWGAPAAALAIAVEEYIHRRNHENAHGYQGGENAHDSLGAYAFGSSGGGDVTSPQLINLRSAAVAQSQAQGATHGDPRNSMQLH